MSYTHIPKPIRLLNERLRSDLGSNPRYAWRWSDDLEHVMEVVDDDGNPQYVETMSPAGVIVMTPETITRKLLPEYEHCWVLCALVETSNLDGELEGTGQGCWVPVSGKAGPVALLPFEWPNLDSTQYITDSIRKERSKTATEKGQEWDESMARNEKARWNRAYDQIRNEATAFYSVPGRKGSVSFPTVIQ